MTGVGELFGRYEILEEIGRGAMGTVHRAHDTVLDREVAIKRMRSGPRVDPELTKRFYREAQVGARLQHSSIVTVYDLGEHEGTSFIVMELLDGIDWRKVIIERRAMPAAKRIELMAQVCDGLAHAHRHTIVHRDLKPSNLFIHQHHQAKILDFGLARMPTSSLTLTGRVLGTPNYMAPEQILGQRVDSRSDLFSTAIVFFEFLTGIHPFRGPIVPRQIVDGEPERLVSINPLLPDSLGLIFERALAKSPDARYQDAAELASDLRAAAREVSEEPGAEAPLSPESSSLSPESQTQVSAPDAALYAADADTETIVYLAPETRPAPPGPNEGGSRE